MKVSDALVEVRKLKEQANRLYSIRNDSFKVIIPKGVSIGDARKDPGKYDITSFEDITKEKIEPIEKEIVELRWRVMKTNVATIVDTESINTRLGSKTSLAMLKLTIDLLKSRLAQLMSLKEHRSSYLSRRISSADDEEREVPQLSELDVESLIKGFENEKTKLQALLDKTNASTDLLE